MVSKISLNLAILMFFCALLIWGPLALIFMIVAIPFAIITIIFMLIFPPAISVVLIIFFPILTFIFFFKTVKFYLYRGKLKLTAEESDEKTKDYAIYTCGLANVICLGLVALQRLEIGAIVYTFATYLLIFAVFTRHLKTDQIKYAVAGLVVLIGSFIGCVVALYVHAQGEYQYQDRNRKSIDLQYIFFQKRDSDLKIPILMRVTQKAKNTQTTIDPNVVDLSFSMHDLIEVQFANGSTNQHPKCEMKNGKNDDLFLPNTYLKEGYLWQKYYTYPEFKIARPSNLKSDYIYRAKNLDSRHTYIEIIRQHDGKMMYQQKLVTYKKDKAECIYGPKDYARELRSAFTAIDEKKAQDFWGFKKSIMATNEQIQQPCNEQMIEPEIYKIGQNLLFLQDNQQMKRPQFLCSQNYVVSLIEEDAYIQWSGDIDVQFFNRNDLAPIDCGRLSYHLKDEHIKKFQTGEIKIEHFNIVERDDPQDCPMVELKLSDGKVYQDHNFTYKRYEF
ncbi:hypothetical protein [Acinetobacter sp. CFCC 10889]|uniref:hypothetical protein n=1 Tax=Acinetobacter sp. CFCC 10889 TaxID=1775557 RepID=UPI0013A6DC57|nr:hypothetical protein [Acinetobacter sp. CFCC 10889]